MPPVEDTPQSNNTNGLAVETLSQMDIDITNRHTGSNEINSATNLEHIILDGLSVETANQKDRTNLPLSNKSPSVKGKESEKDQNDGLTVETTPNNIAINTIETVMNQERNKETEDNRGLTVETTVKTSVDRTETKKNNNRNELRLETFTGT